MGSGVTKPYSTDFYSSAHGSHHNLIIVQPKRPRGSCGSLMMEPASTIDRCQQVYHRRRSNSLSPSSARERRTGESFIERGAAAAAAARRSSTTKTLPLARLAPRDLIPSPTPSSSSSSNSINDTDTGSLMPPNHISPITSPHWHHNHYFFSSGTIVQPPERSDSRNSLIDNNSCLSSMVSELEDLEDIAEEGDEEGDEYGETSVLLVDDGEGERALESLRRFRTQQAMHNLLLEREVQILEAQLQELESIEKEQEEQVTVPVKKNEPCGMYPGLLESRLINSPRDTPIDLSSTTAMDKGFFCESKAGKSRGSSGNKSRRKSKGRRRSSGGSCRGLSSTPSFGRQQQIHQQQHQQQQALDFTVTKGASKFRERTSRQVIPLQRQQEGSLVDGRDDDKSETPDASKVGECILKHNQDEKASPMRSSISALQQQASSVQEAYRAPETEVPRDVLNKETKPLGGISGCDRRRKRDRPSNIIFLSDLTCDEYGILQAKPPPAEEKEQQQRRQEEGQQHEQQQKGKLEHELQVISDSFTRNQLDEIEGQDLKSTTSSQTVVTFSKAHKEDNETVNLAVPLMSLPPSPQKDSEEETDYAEQQQQQQPQHDQPLISSSSTVPLQTDITPLPPLPPEIGEVDCHRVGEVNNKPQETDSVPEAPIKGPSFPARSIPSSRKTSVNIRDEEPQEDRDDINAKENLVPRLHRPEWPVTSQERGVMGSGRIVSSRSSANSSKAEWPSPSSRTGLNASMTLLPEGKNNTDTPPVTPDGHAKLLDMGCQAAASGSTLGGAAPTIVVLSDNLSSDKQQQQQTVMLKKPPVMTPPHMSKQWAEVELLLRKPVLNSIDIRRTLTLAEEGLVFMNHLDMHAKRLNVLRGSLARWLLPFDTNTAASEQSSMIESVLKNVPGCLRGKLTLEEIGYLVCGANSVRQLIRVKIADDADLDQARRALKTAQAFFRKLVDAACALQVEPYDLLVPKDGGTNNSVATTIPNVPLSRYQSPMRNRALGRTVVAL